MPFLSHHSRFSMRGIHLFLGCTFDGKVVSCLPLPSHSCLESPTVICPAKTSTNVLWYSSSFSARWPFDPVFRCGCFLRIYVTAKPNGVFFPCSDPPDKLSTPTRWRCRACASASELGLQPHRWQISLAHSNGIYYTSHRTAVLTRDKITKEFL